MVASDKPVVFLTGAGRGIGKTLAIAFAREGCRVGVSSTTKERNEAVAASIVADGVDALPFQIDVAE
jgi:3-oxoacyl-[acyl-carrier protein] reductase